MARHPDAPDSGEYDSGPPDPATGTEDLAAAARALSEAATALTKALGESLHEVKPRLGRVLSSGLRQAAESLDGVSSAAPTAGASARSRRSAATREGLLAAAARVITEKGYAAASVEDIAAAAGFTKGAVYTHFATKLDLFVALATAHLRAPQPLPAPGGLAAGLAASLRAEGGDPSCVLLTLEVLALAVRDAEFREAIGPAWVDALDLAAAQVAADRGGDAAVPTWADRDTAIGLMALVNTGRALAFLTLPEATDPRATSADVTVRLVERLLSPPVR